MNENPRVEICAFDGSQWLRVAATAVDDDNMEARQHMLGAYPSIQGMYKADDGNMQVLYLKDATATFMTFAGTPRVITF